MIELVGLRKEFTTKAGVVTALDGIDLAVPDAAIHGIVGPSGAGKSTLIRCLTLLERPTAGEVKIDGEDLAALPQRQLRTQRHRIGMVFQHVNLFDSRTAEANVAYPLRVCGAPKRQAGARAHELLELVGLADRGRSYPAQLSGGQRQRVGIARALAAEPSVLLCDEPSSALDWATTRQILELIQRVNRTLGLTVLVITHEMAVVRQVCDSVSLLAEGRIVQSGPIGEMVTDYGSPLARELIPLAARPVGAAGAQLEVSFSSADFSVRDVLRLLTDLGPDTAIETGTLETLAGHRVGRFQIETAAAAVPRVIGQLEAAGLHVIAADQPKTQDDAVSRLPGPPPGPAVPRAAAGAVGGAGRPGGAPNPDGEGVAS
ncbi:MAG: ATP-binding cassette domain-containing protein [Bifidobacteriaceae bacterium]|jgi:D-methionine transport system ATP-binding protein|nr:ATP-binding cassette domain-containing protein [Bifidobacteriaceae bacterium]